jgi:UDP-N-acetyl-D-glucosamine dehydrogenase
LSEERKPDLSFIDSACKTIARNVNQSVLVINESTSFPGTLRNFIKPKIELYSNSHYAHLYAISPERVDPGRSDFNQKNTPRLYSGLTPEATEKTRMFYSSFCENLIPVSSPEVAEAAKLFENTFRQVNIALVNQFARIAHALQIDTREVLDAASTKPYGFMKFLPSAGVGGHCIPVDPTYLVEAAERAGENPSFIHLANQVNLDMPQYSVERIEKDFSGNLHEKSAIVIGVAYKPNVADTRETPAAGIIEQLEKRGANVSWHDPLVQSWKGQSSAELSSYDICLVVTMHDLMNVDKILQSSQYIFDCTGQIPGAFQL